MNKPVLMIHEIERRYLTLNLSNYILTFDDALYSQYYYWPILSTFNTQKILFVSGALINNFPKRPYFTGEFKTFPTCFEAMSRWEETGNLFDYMLVDEIKVLVRESSDLIIGGHGYSHIRTYSTRLQEKVEEIKRDTELMLEWFEINLGFLPIHYCFPFNNEEFLMKEILKEYGFKHFYGGERINIEDL